MTRKIENTGRIAHQNSGKRGNGMTKEELKLKIDSMRARDAETLNGVFKHNEVPGGSLRFNLKLYPNDEFVQYELIDGEHYCLPRGVINHINNNISYPEYSRPDGKFGNEADIRNAGVADGRLKPVDSAYIMKKKNRVSFFSLDFTDQDPALAQETLYQVSL